MLARTPGLDQPTMPEQGEVMADRGLALRAKVGAELGNITLLFVQEHEDLKPGWIGHLLEQVGHAADFGRRASRRGGSSGFGGGGFGSGRLRRGWPWISSVPRSSRETLPKN